MPSPARPRHVAFSAKQKKAQLQRARALKRGEEVDAIPGQGLNGRIRLDRSSRARSTAQAGLALRSEFLAIPDDYATRTRDAAWNDVLPRPIESAAFPIELVDNPAGVALTVPTRPPFAQGETKAEVEKNEERVFGEWLDHAADVVEEWVDGTDTIRPATSAEDPSPNDAASSSSPSTAPRSPSSFEVNLEVWRQLWRVVEASSILLLLVDARCPAVHCPPSLRAYLQSLQPRREIILVLTKTDLVDPEALAGWRAWLKDWWVAGSTDGSWREPQIVSVSSYDTSLLYGDGKARLRPHIPDSARASLLDALQIAHARLLQPPLEVVSNPADMATWKPTVREIVHWDDLAGEDVYVEEEENSPTNPALDKLKEKEQVQVRDPTKEPLTFGLVGQPNVGKSSLLNALLGTTRVRASKTPGKTKHWQTILWGARREVRIVDCPGLVCPSLVPMELQAMSGILPIAQIPSLPACIAFAAKYLPMERIFNVPAPAVVEDDMELKRTWRGPRPETMAPAKPKGPQWTAGDIMDGRATDRGFMTAKSARPDANRAADGMMRALAEGRVRWGFWPPGSSPDRGGDGLWLGDYEGTDSEWEEAHRDRDAQAKKAKDESVDEEEEVEECDDEDDEGAFAKANNASFFAALSMDDGDEEEEE